MSEKKTDQAMRLLEAMEGVDPQLLSRSEKGKKRIPIWRYVGMAASMFALLVLGGLCLVTVWHAGGKAEKAYDNSFTADGYNAARGMAKNSQGDAEARPENAEAGAASENAEYELAVESDGYLNITADLVITQGDSDSFEEETLNSQVGEKSAGETAIAESAGNDGGMTDLSFLRQSDSFEHDKVESAPKEFGERRMEISLDGASFILVTDREVAEQLYGYLTSLPCERFEGQKEGQQAPSEDSVLFLVQADPDETVSFCLQGNLLTKNDSEVYLIVDEEYDYGTIRAELGRFFEGE